MRRITGLSFVTILAATLGTLQAETITSTTLTKVADLPGAVGDATPSSPRGGILQIGDDLWFTTYNGGASNQGAILSYNLANGTFTTQYSFGRTVPGDVTTTGYAGQNPYKLTLTLGTDGLVYYTTFTGGQSSNSPFAGGGAIGRFDPNTVGSTGLVEALWSGGAGSGTAIGDGGIPGYSQPRNFGFSSAIYVSQGAGSPASVYAISNGGGVGNVATGTSNPSAWGTVQKVSLNSSGNFTGETQVVSFTGTTSSQPGTSPGRQPQGGLLLVDKGATDKKIYFATSSSAASALPTLQVIDTVTDSVTVLSTSWADPAVAGANAYSTPMYDAERNSIYSVALNGRVLMWDLETGTQSAHGTPTGNSIFANPVIFGDSIYYIKQGGSSMAGGQIWRFDLDGKYTEMLYNLSVADLFALYQDDFTTSEGILFNQSGTLEVVEYQGVQSLYYLTHGDTNGANLGQLYRLDIASIPVPEPSSIALLGMSVGLWIFRRRRHGS